MQDIGEDTGQRGRNMVRRQPDKRTEAQVVKELKLTVGKAVPCPDGVSRVIKRISGNGEVFVKGVRKKINVYAIRITSD